MPNLSDKQLQAIENMENALGISNHRTIFGGYDEFQKYFDLLSKIIEKNKNLGNAIKNGKITNEEIRKKINDKKEKYFSNYENLRNSGLVYISRFFPTKNQLKKFLSKKTNSREIVKKVFNDLSSFIDEEFLAENFIEQLLENGKNISYIQNKLLVKGFDKDLIKSKINSLKNGGTTLKKDLVESKILTYKNRGKSRTWIKQKLTERREDNGLINSILDNIFGDEGENENINKEIEKLKENGFDKDKIIKKLISKGFRYENIKSNF
ncbi:MAG: RecX family transcriptional regulator [Candidatus Gracilibacteria bacterium]|nr:RecX family transcriptional regulator [Candidatus Gracilibacteria bacterium]MDD4530038.1 RecX family transcriptional regulator [Candidatus Gracilibacteria bacterium]